jgi:AhpD family alkylhydroperoxidase
MASSWWILHWVSIFKGYFLSTFNHSDLMRDINESLAPFRKAQPNAMAGFGQLAKAAITDGELSAKHKELIALSIAVTQRCSGCIGFHVKALVQLGCTRPELEEMLAVCVYMGGGPALMYAAEVIAAWEKLSVKA